MHAFCMAPFRLRIWTSPFLVRTPFWLPFQLVIWTGPFPVEDTHPQKLVLSCWAPKGVHRQLGVKALPVFANILTMLYKKFAGLIG